MAFVHFFGFLVLLIVRKKLGPNQILALSYLFRNTEIISEQNRMVCVSWLAEMTWNDPVARIGLDSPRINSSLFTERI